MIVARIQSHPSRRHLRGRIVDSLDGIPVEAVETEFQPPNPWLGYRACLASLQDSRASHSLILQDDAIPCEGFAAAAEKVAARFPDDPVCLFLGAFPASTAARVRRAKPDVRYVPLGPTSFMPLVAVLWPTRVAYSFLDWSTSANGMTRADDGNAARWVRATRRQVWVTVPSLVEHDDGQPSVKGGRSHVPWAESWRQALLLADAADAYDW